MAALEQNSEMVQVSQEETRRIGNSSPGAKAGNVSVLLL